MPCYRKRTVPRKLRVWRAEWGGDIIFSHGTAASRGVLILISRKHKGQINEIKKDEQGRVVVISMLTSDRMLSFSSIYAPNEDKPEFFEATFALIDLIQADYKVISGDFNTVLDLKWDLRGERGVPTPKQEIKLMNS